VTAWYAGASSWSLANNCNEMHGQQNIKFATFFDSSCGHYQLVSFTGKIQMLLNWISMRTVEISTYYISVFYVSYSSRKKESRFDVREHKRMKFFGIVGVDCMACGKTPQGRSCLL
jgi:hypothetical protein